MEVWQEYDCPNFGIDFDLEGDDMVVKGGVIKCSCCGEDHKAEDVNITTYVRQDNGEMEFLELPESLPIEIERAYQKMKEQTMDVIIDGEITKRRVASIHHDDCGDLPPLLEPELREGEIVVRTLDSDIPTIVKGIC